MGRATALNEAEYLEPDFDPSRLTKPQLRSILAAHGVEDLPPATARKEALLDLFVERVQRRAGEIRRARSRVRPSDKGIAFLDEKSQPSPKRRPSPEARTTRRRGRPAAREAEDNPKEEAGRGTPTTRTRTKSRGRSQSPVKSSSPSRRAALGRLSTPSPKRVSSPHRDSPLAVLRQALPDYIDSPQSATVKLHDRLEYIAGANRLSSAKRVISHHSPSKKSPIKTLKRENARLSSFLMNLSPSLLLRRVSRFVAPLLQFVLVAVVAISLGAYLRFKFFYPIPYCNSAVSLGTLVPPPANNQGVLSALQDLCIPCPLHGTCKNGNLTCADGFVLKPNWVALGSDCIPDRRKLTLVDDIIGKIRTLLAERAGQALCGKLDELGRILTEAQLARILQHSYPLAEWNTSQFESLYKLALQDIAKNPASLQLELSHNPIDGMVMLQSMAPKLSLSCRGRLYFSDIYQRNRLRIWFGGLLTAAVIVMVYTIRSRSHTTRRVDELVQAVLQILAEQDALNRRDPTIPATLSVHQIRDALFFKTSTRLRSRLWPLVGIPPDRSNFGGRFAKQ